LALTDDKGAARELVTVVKGLAAEGYVLPKATYPYARATAMQCLQ
jgi:hypothetical protein